MGRTRTPLRSYVASTLAMALLGITSVVAAAPLAPSGLTTKSISGGTTLSWTDNSADETGFAIERCSGSNCVFGQIGLVTSGVVTFTDTYHPTTTNTYRVRAFNASGSSDYSNTASPGPLFGVGDVFPVVQATPVSGQAPLTVSFDGSGSSGLNGPIANYAWSFGDNGTATGATASWTYNYPGVYAATLEVTGAVFPTQDAKVVIITVTAPPLSAASDLGATTPAKGQVLLTWTNPASSATSLAVQRCTNAGCTSFKQLAPLTLASIFYKDTTVKRGTTYRYRLAASNGTSTVYSNSVQVQAR